MGLSNTYVVQPFQSEEQSYVLVDTAGIRRRARVQDKIEKYSVVKALQAIDYSDAVIVLLDARAGISEQDVSLIGLVLDRGPCPSATRANRSSAVASSGASASM